MKGYDMLFIGILATFVFLVVLITSLPSATHFGIPVNPDITIRTDATSTSLQKRVLKKDFKKRNEVTSSKARDIWVQMGILSKQMDELSMSLAQAGSSASSMKALIPIYAVPYNSNVTSACIPITALKIEPLTSYLRSPRWHESKDHKWFKDRSHLDFLANHCIFELTVSTSSLQNTPYVGTRRVLVDLGCGSYSSSVGWFLQHYPIPLSIHEQHNPTPLTFTEVHAFEVQADLFRLPPRHELGSQVYDSIHFYQGSVGIRDDPPNNLHLTKWLQDTLKLSKEDFVVVKMDLEGAEWDILPLLESSGLYSLIDELFVCIHYQHPDLTFNGWDKFEHSQEDAIALLLHWRSLDILTIGRNWLPSLVVIVKWKACLRLLHPPLFGLAVNLFAVLLYFITIKRGRV